jgi:membrane protein
MGEGFRNSVLAMRASALAFKFMMAAIPALILMNMVIPIVLPQESKDVLFSILSEFLPSNIFGSIREPVSEVSGSMDGGVISLTIFATIYFAVNGMRASMVIFNGSYHIKETRPLLRQFAVAFLMVGILIVIAAVASVFLLNQKVIHWLQLKHVLGSFWSSGIVFFIKYLFFFLFLSMILSWIYFLAPAKRTKYHFFSPGSIIAAFFCVVASVGFDGFIADFTKYNEVYGAISALFILMLFLFILSLIFLIGFEINAALYFGVRNEKESDGESL